MLRNYKKIISYPYYDYSRESCFAEFVKIPEYDSTKEYIIIINYDYSEYDVCEILP